MVEDQVLTGIMNAFIPAPDAARFAAARAVLTETHNRYNIGTYRERSQHLLLKHYFEPDPARHEVTLEGYIADIYNDAGVIEIQTSGFGVLREKLEAFLHKYPVTLVYPSAIQKRNVWIDPDTGMKNEGIYRKSRRGRYSILSELCYIATYFSHPGLQVLNLLTVSSDYRLLDGFGKDRKRRATKIDTIPDALVEVVSFRNRRDLLKIIPFSPGDTATNADLAKAFGMRGRQLWQAVRFLEDVKVIYRAGKRGNTILYTIAAP